MLKSRTLLAISLVGAMASYSLAGSAGLVDTDRFGYSGTIYRYGSLEDAKAGENSTETIAVTDRDLAVVIRKDYQGNSDRNVIMGSWWYTIDTLGRAGYGNTTGNTGVGFVQLYDSDGSTDTEISMGFSNYNGTYYTEYNLNVIGQSANTAEDVSRLSVYDNVNDAGIYHEYELSLTASGLEGVQLSPGVIKSTNHPTSVTGSFSGVFELTENQTSPANQGFYSFDLALNMDNWAYTNKDHLKTVDGEGNVVPDSFSPSTFAVVPLPPAAFPAIGLLGVIGLKKWRSRRKARSL